MADGWRCPSCERCYAPHVEECKHCGGDGAGAPAMPYTPPPTTPAPWQVPYPGYPQVWCDTGTSIMGEFGLPVISR